VELFELCPALLRAHLAAAARKIGVLVCVCARACVCVGGGGGGGDISIYKHTLNNLGAATAAAAAGSVLSRSGTYPP
jgi:hypothetical protein